MSEAFLAAVLVWISGAIGFGVHGYRAGLGPRLFHPRTLASIAGWPILLPVYWSRFAWDDRDRRFTA